MEIYEALREARNISGKSQEYMALELGIARKTVQNWEKGISEPTLGQAVDWFKLLGINPVPYLFQVVYPDMEGTNPDDDTETIKQGLENLLFSLPKEGLKQLMYLFYGEHGSSPRAVLNMIIAHLQTPMGARVSQSNIILKNYEMARKKNRLTDKNSIQPDIKLLKDAIDKGEAAEINGAGAYILVSK